MEDDYSLFLTDFDVKNKKVFSKYHFLDYHSNDRYMPQEFF